MRSSKKQSQSYVDVVRHHRSGPPARGAGPRKRDDSRNRQPPNNSVRPLPSGLNDALKQLANHSVEQTKMLAKVSMASKAPGTFGSLGGDVDSMIEHGQQAWAAVSRLLNVETKAVIGNFTSSAVGQTPYSIDLTGTIAQGVTDSTRTGDSVKVNEVRIPYSLHMNGASTTNSVFRIMVTQANDEALLAGEVLQSNATQYAAVSVAAWDYKKQYRILHDTGPIPINSARPVHSGYLDVNLKDGHVQYSAASTTALSGCLQIWFWSNEAANTLTVYGSYSIQFVDN